MRIFTESDAAEMKFESRQYNRFYYKLLHPEWLADLRRRRKKMVEEIVVGGKLHCGQASDRPGLWLSASLNDERGC